MPRLITQLFALATAISLSGCIVVPTTKSSLQEAGTDILNQNPCDGPSNPLCLFINAPVLLGAQTFSVPTRNAQFFKTQAAVEFVDNQQRKWIAPPLTLTDGASIPKVFVPIVGDPRSKEFLGAATLHDAYCGIGNEELPTYQARRWQDVHRMFFDTLIVGGTDGTTAKIMFAAVYLAGPRWRNPRRDISHVPPSIQQAAMKQAKRFIEREDPDLNSLQKYLDWLEKTHYIGFGALREGGSAGAMGFLYSAPPPNEYPGDSAGEYGDPAGDYGGVSAPALSPGEPADGYMTDGYMTDSAGPAVGASAPAI